MKTIEEQIDERLEIMRLEEVIVCPFCDKELEDDGELYNAHRTFHGRDEPQEERCHNCEKDFWVKEDVRRTYESFGDLDAWLVDN